MYITNKWSNETILISGVFVCFCSPMLCLQVWVRGRLHTSRSKGKTCFIVVRQQHHTLQALAVAGPDISKAFIKFLAAISRESIVDFKGFVRAAKVCCTSPVVGYFGAMAYV